MAVRILVLIVSPVAGQSVFGKLCAQCHKIYGEGQDVGPELTANGRNDFDQLVSNVFDPSLVIGPGYQATTIATTEGRILTGLLIEDGQVDELAVALGIERAADVVEALEDQACVADTCNCT